MAKAAKTTFRCAECGWTTLKWVGRCGECQAWGTVEEAGAPAPSVVAAAPVTSRARPITEISVESAEAVPTGVDELDRVLGGGAVPGGVVLLAGEPGVGKSTLLLEGAAMRAAKANVLYVTGEESAGQVRLRAERLNALSEQLYLAAETSVATLASHVDAVAPQLLIVDSVQTMVSPDTTGVPGGVTQIRQVPGALIQIAKERGNPTGLGGPVTLEGRRPLITEVQALVAPTPLPAPRRATSGLDTSRVNMILAVLEKRTGMKLANMDVYASTVGGVKLGEPSVDLALAMAAASSSNDVALPSGFIAVGEVGLAGDVRSVNGVRRRVAEAQRLGFTQAVVPRHFGDPVEGIRVHEVEELSEALSWVERRGRRRSARSGTADD